MRQGHLRGHIPAVGLGVRRLGVDDNVAIRLGVTSPLCALVVRLSTPAAPMDADDDGGIGSKIVGNKEPHARVGRVGAIRRDLGEGGSGNRLSTEGDVEEGQRPDTEEGPDIHFQGQLRTSTSPSPPMGTGCSVFKVDSLELMMVASLSTCPYVAPRTSLLRGHSPTPFFGCRLRNLDPPFQGTCSNRGPLTDSRPNEIHRTALV